MSKISEKVANMSPSELKAHADKQRKNFWNNGKGMQGSQVFYASKNKGTIKGVEEKKKHIASKIKS